MKSKYLLGVLFLSVALSAKSVDVAAQANNNFGLSLYKTVLDGMDLDDNVIVSPLSASGALSMTLLGARGGTADVMYDILGFPFSESTGRRSMTDNDIAVATSSLQKDLTSQRPSGRFIKGTELQVHIANRVWANALNLEVNPEFATLLNDHFDLSPKKDGVIVSKRFTKKTYTEINDWVEGRTNSMIQDLLDGLRTDAPAVLVNALYFQGQWEPRFSVLSEAPEFQVHPTIKNKAPFIRGKFDAKYTSNSEVQIVSVGIRQASKKVKSGARTDQVSVGPSRYVLDLLLPKTRSKIDSLSALTGNAEYEKLLGSMTEQSVQVTMPKFSFENSFKFKDVLSDMGMGIAFTSDADLSGLGKSTADLFIDEVIQKTAIDLDEKGLKAAAATAVVIGKTMAKPFVNLVFDRPFMFVLRDTETNAILFVGRLSNPTP